MEEEKVTEQIVKTKNIKNLFKWGGWKKEFFWIFLILLLLFSVYSYKTDIASCEEYVKDPCKKCLERNQAIDEVLQEQQTGGLLIPEDVKLPY